MKLVPHGDPPVYFTFPGLGALGVPHATTTRHCPGVAPWSEGASPLRAEAATALAATGLDLARVSWARQVHGADVARATPAGGLVGVADVLVSTEPGLPLAIFTADCLAVTLCDPEARVLALAHVGWRGTVRGTAQAAVAAAREAGARVERLRAAIGPSIGPCCYEVDEPVISQVSSAYPSLWERWVRSGRAGHWMLDLWTANEKLLQRAGLASGRIENPRLCTACHPQVLPSYRRGHRGRLVTLAALP